MSAFSEFEIPIRKPIVDTDGLTCVARSSFPRVSETCERQIDNSTNGKGDCRLEHHKYWSEPRIHILSLEEDGEDRGGEISDPEQSRCHQCTYSVLSKNCVFDQTKRMPQVKGARDYRDSWFSLHQTNSFENAARHYAQDPFFPNFPSDDFSASNNSLLVNERESQNTKFVAFCINIS